MKRLLLIVIAGIALVYSQGILSRNQPEPVSNEGDIYLPETGNLKFISLGHDGLVADLVLAKALTYYGTHYFERQTFGYKHLKKLFYTAVEMDPMNTDAFLMAANILSDIDIQSSIDILKLGMRYHPENWKFPEMIGYRYFFNLNDPHHAARYYEIASRMPGHPPYVPSLSEKFYRESGRYEQALRVLYNFYSTTTDRRLKESFKQSIEAVQEKMKNREFQLKATVLNIRDAATLEFRPDPDNPQFRSLKPVETLRIPGITCYDLEPVDEKDKKDENYVKEKIAALFQLEFARLLLVGQEKQEIKIAFQRDAEGRLLRDKENRLLGTVTMKYDRDYRQAAQESGIMTNPEQFPPRAVDLELKEVYRYVGKVVSIRYTVHRVKFEGDNIYLNAASENRNTFSVVVPGPYIANFADKGEKDEKGEKSASARDYFRQLTGKQITVSGFAGIRERIVEIKLYHPIQLK